MHASGSFLKTVVERIRYYVDEAIADAKFTNDYIVRHVVMPEMVNVYSRLGRNFDNPVILRYGVTLDDGTEYYVLPPNVGEVVRVAQMDTEKVVTHDMKPRSDFHPSGPNWALEGNVIAFRPLPASGDWDIWYIPSGDFLPQYAEDGEVVTEGTFKLGSLNELGQKDMRVNAYAGAMLRVLGSTEGVWEERIIEGYDPASLTAEVTLRVPLSVTTAQEEVTYEIVPGGIQSLMQAVAVSGAMNLASAKSISQKQYQFFLMEYRKAIKTIGDQLANMQGRTFKGWGKRTVDNADAVAFVLQ